MSRASGAEWLGAYRRVPESGTSVSSGGGPVRIEEIVPAVTPGRLVPPGTAPRPPCRRPAGLRAAEPVRRGRGRGPPAPPHVSPQDHQHHDWWWIRARGRSGVSGCTPIFHVQPGSDHDNGAAGTDEAARAARHHARAGPRGRPATGHRVDRGQTRAGDPDRPQTSRRGQRRTPTQGGHLPERRAVRIPHQPVGLVQSRSSLVRAAAWRRGCG